MRGHVYGTLDSPGDASGCWSLGKARGEKEGWWNLTWFRNLLIDTPRQHRLLTANGEVAACFSRGHDTDPDINSTFSDYHHPVLSIPNVTMTSIIKNVVHWGSHSQRQKTPVQIDLCEVFCCFNLSSYIGSWFFLCKDLWQKTKICWQRFQAPILQ